MKIITRKDSETGKRFQVIVDELNNCCKAAKELSIKYGFDQWKMYKWPDYGGISLVLFDAAPDQKVWRRKEDGWYPKLSSKDGKKIYQEFQALPKVKQSKISDTVFPDNEFEWSVSIGYNLLSDEYFGFHLRDDWKTPIPIDCKEVTNGEWKEIFKIPSQQYNETHSDTICIDDMVLYGSGYYHTNPMHPLPKIQA